MDCKEKRGEYLGMNILTEEMLEKFVKYHEIPGHGEWGSLHIVMADNNFEDEDVQFCVDDAINKGDFAGEFLGNFLLELNEQQREEIKDTVSGCIHRI